MKYTDLINKSINKTDKFETSLVCEKCGCHLNRVIDTNNKVYLIGRHSVDCKSKNAKIKYEIYNDGPKYADNSFLNKYPKKKVDGTEGFIDVDPQDANKSYDCRIVVHTNNPDRINSAKKYSNLYNNRIVSLDDGTDLRPIFPQLYDPDFKNVIFEDSVICLKCELKPHDIFFNTKKGYVRLIARYGRWNEKNIGIYIKMYSDEDNERIGDIVKNRFHACRDIFVISNQWKVTNWSNKDIDFILESVLLNNALYWPIYL